MTEEQRLRRNAYMRDHYRKRREARRQKRLDSYGLTDAERRDARDTWMLSVLKRAKLEGRLRQDGSLRARLEIKSRLTPHEAYHVLRMEYERKPSRAGKAAKAGLEVRKVSATRREFDRLAI